jgi:hypothetical protein
VADLSLSGRRGGREFDRIALKRGFPRQVVSDNGMELTSHAILRWPQARGVDWPKSPQTSHNRTALRRASSADSAMNA